MIFQWDNANSKTTLGSKNFSNPFIDLLDSVIPSVEVITTKKAVLIRRKVHLAKASKLFQKFN